jgi:hypothetical protein
LRMEKLRRQSGVPPPLRRVAQTNGGETDVETIKEDRVCISRRSGDGDARV